jgi:hypothetical protein
MSHPVDIRAAFRDHLAQRPRPLAPVAPVTTVRQRTTPTGEQWTPSAVTPEMVPGIDRTLTRLATFLVTHLRDYPLDAAACCLVVAARLVEALEPADTLEQLQTWARAAADTVDAMQVQGFERARGVLAIPSAPDEELCELTRLLWALVRESSRESGGPDLALCVGILLPMAWGLAGGSLQVTPREFAHAAGLAWTFADAWMPVIETERKAA